MDVNGGTVNNVGWLVMGRAQTDAGETGILNIYGGLMTYAGGGILCNWGTNQTSIINMMGGVVTNTGQCRDRHQPETAMSTIWGF